MYLFTSYIFFGHLWTIGSYLLLTAYVRIKDLLLCSTTSATLVSTNHHIHYGHCVHFVRSPLQPMAEDTVCYISASREERNVASPPCPSCPSCPSYPSCPSCAMPKYLKRFFSSIILYFHEMQFPMMWEGCSIKGFSENLCKMITKKKLGRMTTSLTMGAKFD